MADVKISALNALGTAPDAADLIPVVDVSGSETKKLRIDELFTNPNVTGTVTANNANIDIGSTYTASTQTVAEFRGGDNGNSTYGSIEIGHSASNRGLKITGGRGAAIGEGYISVIDNAGTSVDAIRIKEGGDISFFEDTGTTAKFYWDASAERLGIGGTPFAQLDVVKDTGSATIDPAVIRITSTTAAGDWDLTSPWGSLEFYSYDSSGDGAGVKAQIGAIMENSVGGNAGLGFYTENGTFGLTERVRIDSLGNVGIGTTSPVDTGFTYGDLTINGSVGAFISLQSNGSTTGVLQTIGTETRLSTSVASGYLAFRTDTGVSGTERMRIDSSGNLLVGKTTGNSIGTEGIEIDGGSDRIMVTRDGNVPLFLNRLTSDGDVAEFRKDGTTVGRIGVGGGSLTVNSSGSTLVFSATDVAVQLSSTEFRPFTADDATVNLGAPAQRFKDLYLSGGVYLGGTGAANLLDDYETGTFAPVIADASTGGNTATVTTLLGTYTKTGRKVTLTVYAIDIDRTGLTLTNSLVIRNLPFVVLSPGNQSIYVGSCRLDQFTFSGNYVTPETNGAGSTSCIFKETISGSPDQDLLVSSLAASGTSDLFMTITYFTES